MPYTTPSAKQIAAWSLFHLAFFTRAEAAVYFMCDESQVVDFDHRKWLDPETGELLEKA